MIRLLLILTVIPLGFLIEKKNPKLRNTDDFSKEQLVLEGVKTYVEQLHFSPKEIDDEYSKQAFKNYLKSLDYNKRFFTQEDISILQAYEHQLDDQLKSLDLSFFDLSVQLYEHAFESSRHYYQQVLDEPLDINDEEYLELDPDHLEYPQDSTALKELWRKRIEYEVISRVKRDMDQNEEKSAEEQKSLEEMVADAKDDTREMFDKYFESMEDLRRSDHFENYVNAITTVVDPHTNYFSPKDKQNFDIGMSGKLEGIGARLTKDGENTKVSSVVIGGPAWRGKELEASDLILKVAQGVDGDWLDIIGWRLDDVVQKIRGKSGTTVRLFLKKKDGSTQEISIVRDEVEVGEQFAKSYILKSPQIDGDIGYIDLPRFYSDFSKNGRNCASDVAQEIEKLKQDSVSGIILDLRSNPGGSLRDVVDMSGLFIEKGPIVQAVQKNNKRKVILEDKDNNVAYSGPLIILTNQFSASASEIMAAAMQDYNRAVIIGVGNSTYGKGTVQRFFSLDKAFQKMLGGEKLGDIKMTIQKYYRINGSSVQKKGVTPDIILPGKYSYIDVGEKEYETCMDWNEIDGVEFSQDVFHFDLEKIKSLSESRTSENQSFKLLDEQAKIFKKHKDQTQISLNLDQYSAAEDQQREEAKKFDHIFDVDSTLQVLSTSSDSKAAEQDSTITARWEEDLKTIQKDIYLSEALAVMQDMLSLAMEEAKKITYKSEDVDIKEEQ